MTADGTKNSDASDDRPLRVTVLAGGPSAEREVSLASGGAIAAALAEKGHDVELADIGPSDLSALEIPADVIFPALHGTFGEDGTLQRIMEQRGLCFIGSGSDASAAAMDKVQTKRIALQRGVTTPDFQVIESTHDQMLPPPVVIKPVAEGSSVMTGVARDPAAARSAADAVIARYGRVLVERFVEGIEVTVGILGDRTLPPIWIRPKREFYDFEAKYQDNATEYVFETGLPAAVVQRAETWSLDVFRALGCRHLARIDWIVDADGIAWLLEVNTLPGFTSHSLVPKAAARIGISFADLTDRLVRMALEEQA